MDCPRCFSKTLHLSDRYDVFCSECGFHESMEYFLHRIFPELSLGWEQSRYDGYTPHRLFRIQLANRQFAIFHFNQNNKPMGLKISADSPHEFIPIVQRLKDVFQQYLGEIVYAQTGISQEVHSPTCPSCGASYARLISYKNVPWDLYCSSCGAFATSYHLVIADRMKYDGYMVDVQYGGKILMVTKYSENKMFGIFPIKEVVFQVVFDRKYDSSGQGCELVLQVKFPEDEHPDFRKVAGSVKSTMTDRMRMIGVMF